MASLPVTADELPPSYDTATIDYTGARPTTRARGQSAVSTSSTDTRPSIQRELSFVNVSTPRGCCTSDGVNDTPMGNGNSQKKREAPLPSPMAIEPPRRSYFSPHVRRRGDLSSPPPPHPPPTSLSLIGGGVENPIYTGVIQARDKGKGKENRKSNEKGPSSPTAQSNTLVAGRATTQNTINPLQLATAQQDGSNATPRGNSGISAALSSPASPQNPPGYQPNHPISPKASPQARGINIGPASKQVFVPHPYKEYPSPTAPGTFRGFCGHCSGGLVYREGKI